VVGSKAFYAVCQALKVTKNFGCLGFEIVNAGFLMQITHHFLNLNITNSRKRTGNELNNIPKYPIGHFSR
jgi:hypothetical protein